MITSTALLRIPSLVIGLSDFWWLAQILPSSLRASLMSRILTRSLWLLAHLLFESLCSLSFESVAASSSPCASSSERPRLLLRLGWRARAPSSPAFHNHFKTLSKAQRTRGLSSAYQSNLMGHITSSNTNIDQISSSESQPSINFKISTKHQHFG